MTSIFFVPQRVCTEYIHINTCQQSCSENVDFSLYMANRRTYLYMCWEILQPVSLSPQFQMVTCKKCDDVSHKAAWSRL